MADPRATQDSDDKRTDRQPSLMYAAFDTDQAALPTDRDRAIRQLTILHTGYGRGLVEPAEDSSCPT